ncbi:MAG: methylated-DNA--[protein]-cysteine S-methyltransferase [Planctomycetota bacterium]
MDAPTHELQTPLGTLTAIATRRGLAALEFPGPRTARAAGAIAQDAIDDPELFDRLGEQLAAYFAADRSAFDLPLDLRGSDFELRVWRALLEIPTGQTRSYAQIAESLDTPGASRAVGLANGRNRIAIVVPCHRVIGADGSLTGYGGGLDRKRKLLELEGAIATEPALF